MRDEWYGDKRDLVKWGILIVLAEQAGLQHIVQIAYYRPTTWPLLNIDGIDVPIPPPVLSHSRNVGDVIRLGGHVRITVVDAALENPRAGRSGRWPPGQSLAVRSRLSALDSRHGTERR